MVTLKEATEIALKEVSASGYYILGCEDCKKVFGFHLLPKGVAYEPGKNYYCMNQMITVEEKTGKLTWMDTLIFEATYGIARKRTKNGMVMNTLDISDYLPEENRKAAKEWYNL